MTANSLWIRGFVHRSKSLSKEAWKSNYLAACDSFGYPEVAWRFERALCAPAELFADFARSSFKPTMHTRSCGRIYQQKEKVGVRARLRALPSEDAHHTDEVLSSPRLTQTFVSL